MYLTMILAFCMFLKSNTYMRCIYVLDVDIDYTYMCVCIRIRICIVYPLKELG